MKTNTTPYSKAHHGIIKNRLGRARYSLHDGQRGCWPTSSGTAGGFCCARASSRVFLALSVATTSAKAIHQIASTRRMRLNNCMTCECWLTIKLSDRRRKRPVGCKSRGQIIRTVRLPSGAAVRCSALVRRLACPNPTCCIWEYGNGCSHTKGCAETKGCERTNARSADTSQT